MSSLKQLFSSAFEPMVYSQTLENGVRLVVDEDRRFQSVAIAVMLIGGPSDEDAERRGVTHLLEHMLFKRTKKWSALEIASRNDDLGGTLNAFTDPESLVVHGVFPASMCQSALEVIGSLITEVDFRDDELSIEKDVVRQEILEAEDDPADAVHERFSQLFWPGSPLSFPITGSPETVQRIEVVDLNRRLSEILVGCRVIVGAAGNVDQSMLVRWVEETFGGLPPGDSPAPQTVVTGSGFATLERSVSQVHVLFGTPWSKLQDEDFFTAMVLSTLLGEGASSRLFQHLREQNGLCYEVHSDMESYDYAGLLSIYSVIEKPQLDKVLIAIVNEVHALFEHGVSEAELDRAIRFNVSRLLIETDGAEDRLFRAIYSQKDLGRYRSSREVIERMISVSKVDVEELIHRRWSNAAWLLVLGGNTSNIVLPQQVLHLLAPV